GELHLREIANIAHTSVDDEAAAAARLCGGRQQVAEITVDARRRRREHENVPFAKLFDGDVDHPIVARGSRDRDGGARNTRTGIDWPHVWCEQPDAVLSFMHGGDA